MRIYCEYSEYSFESQYLKCECDVVEQDLIDTKEPEKLSAKSLANTLVNVLKYSNYKVLKCKNLVFSKKIFFKNIGSLLCILYFLGYILSLILFCFKRINYLKIEIQRLYENNQLEFNSSKNIIFFYNEKAMKNEKTIKPKLVKDNNKIKTEKKIINNKKKESKTKNKSKKKLKYPPKKHHDLSRNIDKSKTQKKIRLSVELIKDNKSQESKGILNRNSNHGIQYTQNTKYISNQNEEITKRKSSKNISLYNNEIEFKKNNQKYDDLELNSLDYLVALELDHRKFFRVYWSLIKREHLIIFTFFSWNDYNIFSIKLSKFFFLICTDMALNVFFFSDESMHNVHQSGGKYIFFEQIFQMVISTLVSQLLQIFLNYLTMTDIDYYKIKSVEKNDIMKAKVFLIIRCIKCKIFIFYLFTFLLFLFYW